MEYYKSNDCNNAIYILVFDAIGSMLLYWVKGKMLFNNRKEKLVRSFFTELDGFVEESEEIASNNEAFVIGIVQFVFYSLSTTRNRLSDIFFSISTTRIPLCDETLLVINTLLIRGTNIKNVVAILNKHSLFENFIEKISGIIKVGETYCSQEYSLEMILRIVLYENTVNNQDRRAITQFLPRILSDRIRNSNYKDCIKVYDDKRWYLNTVNINNTNVDSFLVNSLYIIDEESTGDSSLCIIDERMRGSIRFKLRLIANNIWLDINLRILSFEKNDFLISEIKSFTFDSSQSLLLCLIVTSKEIRYVMSFQHAEDLTGVIKQINNRLLRLECQAFIPKQTRMNLVDTNRSDYYSHLHQTESSELIDLIPLVLMKSQSLMSSTISWILFHHSQLIFLLLILRILNNITRNKVRTWI